ncbi:MAG: vitamin B12-dependent ribonucleotide reductase, partial [Acidobacteria bacterium]|nr:vitamin B12-dependent ribonucleotide reductase [Acidobacteriota bacterium]
SAGTITSGGKTRRAAKMVILDADHPDIEDFIWCKAREEQKARVLAEAGFDMSLDGIDTHSIQYQNANNSVRVSDDFMRAVIDDEQWDLSGRLDGATVRTVKARELFGQIADAAWQCADPGIQFDTTINRWHTAASTGRINASNPCSEYMHLDDSACNLASLNLLAFADEASGEFDVDGFRHAVDVVFIAQDILVGNADYPTDAIGQTSLEFRQLGIGYANLGALLMTSGHAYDSTSGRAYAASLTALMTGQAYRCSTRMARRLGAFGGYQENRNHLLDVLNRHRKAVAEIDAASAPESVLGAAREVWEDVCREAPTTGVRNSQASVLAPTGTIGLLMDCDTTGVEPDLGLVKTKTLVGGGTMSIVNESIGRALSTLGYEETERDAICAYIDEHNTVLGAPYLDPKHVAVFATSMGDNVIHHTGHINMMAAVQPFLSGAISKTVNLPETATVEDIETLLIDAWQLGLKAVAVYRDNCKVAQPLSAGNGNDTKTAQDSIEDPPRSTPVRRRLPRDRSSRTFEFRVADCKGFVTVGEYDDGSPGELFIRVSKQGSTLAGIMDAFAISVSHGLQYGVPLRAFVEAYVGMRFEPAGMTDDPELRIASSLMDYLFRRLAVRYLSLAEREELHIWTTDERIQPTLPGVEETTTVTRQGLDIPADPTRASYHVDPQVQLDADRRDVTERTLSNASNAPLCMQCGVGMQRAGSCFVCTNCGTTSGCS